VNIPLMKAVDGLIGRLLTSLLPVPAKSNVPVSLHSILIIRPGGIGDVVLLAPVINYLRTAYPAATLSVLAERRNAGVCALIPAVDQLYCYDKPAEFMQALQGRYDVVFDTEQWHRLSAVVSRFMPAPIKIGFGTNERSRMFTHLIPYSHDDYEVISFTHLLEPLTGSCAVLDASSPFLSVPPAAATTAEILFETLEGKQVVTIFPGASIPERRWGADRFKAVAELLQEEGYGVVVVGGADDLHDGLVIVGECGLNLAGKTLLAETAAVIARTKLLISGDSGVLHLAIGLGVPTVSLFGPGRALKWAPQGDHHTVINKRFPCSPCTAFGTTPPCPYHARCMQAISVDEVVEAALCLLQKKQGQPNDCP
jgi:ADP-heptose:LPS heptosyltransferase